MDWSPIALMEQALILDGDWRGSDFCLLIKQKLNSNTKYFLNPSSNILMKKLQFASYKLYKIKHIVMLKLLGGLQALLRGRSHIT